MFFGTKLLGVAWWDFFNAEFAEDRRGMVGGGLFWSKSGAEEWGADGRGFYDFRGSWNAGMNTSLVDRRSSLWNQ